MAPGVSVHARSYALPPFCAARLRLLVAFCPCCFAACRRYGACRCSTGWTRSFMTSACVPPCRARWTSVVIVDLDERSLQEIGHWPRGGDKLGN